MDSEREEGELSEDYDDISDTSSFEVLSMVTGKSSICEKKSFRDIWIPINDDPRTKRSYDFNRRSPTPHRIYECHRRPGSRNSPPRTDYRRKSSPHASFPRASYKRKSNSSTSPPRAAYRRKSSPCTSPSRSEHRRKRLRYSHKDMPSHSISKYSDSSDDSGFIRDKTLKKQLRDAVNINKPTKTSNPSLRSRLSNMIDTKSEPINKDNLEETCPTSVNSETPNEQPANPAKETTSEDIDEELFRLRLSALKTLGTKQQKNKNNNKLDNCNEEIKKDINNINEIQENTPIDTNDVAKIQNETDLSSKEEYNSVTMNKEQKIDLLQNQENTSIVVNNEPHSNIIQNKINQEKPPVITVNNESEVQVTQNSILGKTIATNKEKIELVQNQNFVTSSNEEKNLIINNQQKSHIFPVSNQEKTSIIDNNKSKVQAAPEQNKNHLPCPNQEKAAVIASNNQKIQLLQNKKFLSVSKQGKSSVNNGQKIQVLQNKIPIPTSNPANMQQKVLLTQNKIPILTLNPANMQPKVLLTQNKNPLPISNQGKMKPKVLLSNKTSLLCSNQEKTSAVKVNEQKIQVLQNTVPMLSSNARNSSIRTNMVSKSQFIQNKNPLSSIDKGKSSVNTNNVQKIQVLQSKTSSSSSVATNNAHKSVLCSSNQQNTSNIHKIVPKPQNIQTKPILSNKNEQNINPIKNGVLKEAQKTNNLNKTSVAEEEDADILRAKLLANMSNKISNNNKTIHKPITFSPKTNRMTYRKFNVNNSKYSYTRTVASNKVINNVNKFPSAPVNKFIINVSSNSDSEEEIEKQDDRNINKTEKENLTENLKDKENENKFEEKVTMFLKNARHKSENQLNPSSTSSHLKFQQVDRNILKRKYITKLKSLNRSLTNLNNSLKSKLITVKGKQNTRNQRRAKYLYNSPTKNLLVKSNSVCKEKQLNKTFDRLQTTGKCNKELSTLKVKISEAKVAKERALMHLKKISIDYRNARAEYTKKNRSYVDLMKLMVQQQSLIDERSKEQQVIGMTCSTSALKNGEIPNKTNSTTSTQDTTNVQKSQEPQEFNENIDILNYSSPLELLNNVHVRKSNPIVELCPFQIAGKCEDERCYYRHLPNKNTI